MPSEALAEAYYEWLSEGSGDRICLPYYLLSKTNFSAEMEAGGTSTITEMDLAKLDAQIMAGEIDAARMERVDTQFVLGHMTVARLPSWEAATDWVASDPIQVRGGYEGGTHLHEWRWVDEPALRVAPAGEIEQVFAVHCVHWAVNNGTR